ncbi:MAG: D-glycero-beta-D-manno-heptose 1-phosphate adenylyltransferase [Flavobacteriales bacterium]|jgi:D-beta-D-heptose 7-phosphate kinase/D-beta-D-heptose 1-phosphate adenosyltransferase
MAFLETIDLWKQNGLRIVFTNGCFDLLHSGHLSLLEAASKLGDKLVVGLNSDDSIRRLKGLSRPIRPLQERQKLLEALRVVDMVIPFEEDTPLELIRNLNPQVLVKGGDYLATDVVGADFIKKNGGEIVIVPLIPNQSTTQILKSISEKDQ